MQIFKPLTYLILPKFLRIDVTIPHWMYLKSTSNDLGIDDVLLLQFEKEHADLQGML